MKDHLIIVPGGLNTDIIGMGVEKLLSPGELTLGGELKIGPGGKARDMAQMAAAYLGESTVAMIGRSSKDPFGLWEIPLQSLSDAGVDTTFFILFQITVIQQKFEIYRHGKLGLTNPALVHPVKFLRPAF